MHYVVTIGIPVYNVEKYIRRSLDSALAQTFESIEYLILDDCGNDGSMDIVRDYQRTHPRGRDIHIIYQPQNQGIGCARNRIIEDAAGKYIYFMDADDCIAPDTIEKLYTNAQKYSAQMVYGSYEKTENFENHTKCMQKRYPFKTFLRENEYPDYAFGHYDSIQANVWNILIEKECIIKNDLLFLPINYWEDFIFTMILPAYVNRVVLLPDITYYYNCHTSSLSNFQFRRHIEKREVQDTINALNRNKELVSIFRTKPFFPYLVYKLMKTGFYVVCTILRQKDCISPAFTKREMRDVLKSPVKLTDIFRFRRACIPNLLLYILSVLPPSLSVGIIEFVGKRKKLI